MKNHINILIISPSWVGDFIIAQSLLIKLKTNCPHSKITVFAGSWAKELAARMPQIDDFIVNPFEHGQIKIKERYSLAQKLKRLNFTHAYILPLSYKSSLVPFFAKIPNRIGFVGEFRYYLLNQIFKLDKKALPKMVDRFVALANGGRIDNSLQYPNLVINQDNRKLLMEKFNISTNAIFLCPAVEYGPSKQWPWSHFADLAILLIKSGYSVVLLGSKKDITLGEKIIQSINNDGIPNDSPVTQLHNLIGKTSLTDVIDLLSIAKAVVANDSGLLHLAAATFSNSNNKNQKIIALYGSIPPSIAPALYINTQIVYLGLECSPCGSRTCKFGHYNCMKEILPKNIADLIQLPEVDLKSN